MEWNIQELGGAGRRSSVPVQNIAATDDKVLLKEIGYTLLAKIGTGSFSKVWKAKSDTDINRDVAIKIIQKKKSSTEFLEKFLPRELAIIQKFKHANLLKYYEITESPTRVCIVMQYAENGTMADLIGRHKYLSEDMSRNFFNQLIDVVEYLHRTGVVHRDIKCENLLLDRSYRLLLSDFGFAKADVLPDRDGRIQKSKTYCGSYAYASPEILANTPYNPFLADVWCMGMVLYFMLVGAMPYKQSDLKALIQAKKNPPLFPMAPAVSVGSKTFIWKMLVVEPERHSIPQLRRDPWMAASYERLQLRIANTPEPLKDTPGPSRLLRRSVSQPRKDVGTSARSLPQTPEVSSIPNQTSQTLLPIIGSIFVLGLLIFPRVFLRYRIEQG